MARLTAKEQLEKLGAYEKARVLEYWQAMPYELKVAHARELVRDFYNNPDVNGCCISVGGLDSITLTLFIRSLGSGGLLMNAESKRLDVWDAGFHVREAQISLIRAGEHDLASILATVCTMCEKRERELADEASREREQIDAELNREYERSV